MRSHETWISKILKFDFHENEKSLSSETKYFFLVSQVRSLLDLKSVSAIFY